jgi:hypothetical protein
MRFEPGKHGLLLAYEHVTISNSWVSRRNLEFRPSQSKDCDKASNETTVVAHRFALSPQFLDMGLLQNYAAEKQMGSVPAAERSDAEPVSSNPT